MRSRELFVRLCRGSQASRQGSVACLPPTLPASSVSFFHSDKRDGGSGGSDHDDEHQGKGKDKGKEPRQDFEQQKKGSWGKTIVPDAEVPLFKSALMDTFSQIKVTHAHQRSQRPTEDKPTRSFRGRQDWRARRDKSPDTGASGLGKKPRWGEKPPSPRSRQPSAEDTESPPEQRRPTLEAERKMSLVQDLLEIRRQAAASDADSDEDEMRAEASRPARRLSFRKKTTEASSHVGEQIGRIRMSEAARKTRPEQSPNERSRSKPQPKAQQQQQLPLFKYQPSDDSRSTPSDEGAGDARRRREENRKRREMERMSKSQRAKMLRMQREQRRLLRPERSMNAQEAEEMDEYIRGEDGIITQSWNNTLAYHRFVEDQLYGLRNILPLMEDERDAAQEARDAQQTYERNKGWFMQQLGIDQAQWAKANPPPSAQDDSLTHSSAVREALGLTRKPSVFLHGQETLRKIYADVFPKDSEYYRMLERSSLQLYKNYAIPMDAKERMISKMVFAIQNIPKNQKEHRNMYEVIGHEEST